MRIRAALFDYNGVILDDEPVHCEAFLEVLAPHGLSFSESEYYGTLLGLPDDEILRLLLERRRRSLPSAEALAILAEKARAYRRLVTARPVEMPGLPALLADLSRHIPLGIVSGARREEIELDLERLGLAGPFAAVVAAGEYRRPKPDPAPFRAGREKLARATGRDLPPGEVVVFEDSPNGIASAAAAGMRVIGVTTRVPPERLPGCIAHLQDFTGCSYAYICAL